MLPARRSSSSSPWAALLVTFFIPALACAQVRGTASGLRFDMPDRQAMAYVTSCLGSAPPRPVELYARGGWYLTDDLREQMLERGGNIEGIALVWRQGNHPRAVYQWNHDDEFNRDVVACLDQKGNVIRSQSHYTPGDSEPNQRWVYIHTLVSSPHQTAPHSSGRFTDAKGHPMGRPHLSTEDQDFIAGERVFRQWKDFDFASLVDAKH